MRITFNVRAARERAELSQSELAKKSGLSLRQVKAIESGETQESYPHTVAALREALHPEKESVEATYGLEQLLTLRALERHCDEYGEWAASLIRLVPDYDTIYKQNGKFVCELVEDFIEARRAAAEAGFEPYVTAPEIWDSLLEGVVAELKVKGMAAEMVGRHEIDLETAEGTKLRLGTTTGEDIDVEIPGDLKMLAWELNTLENASAVAELIREQMAKMGVATPEA
jgi:transcriptional regulator with XRE-family HTH domain